MAYQITNQLGTTLNHLILVAEDRPTGRQPRSVLVGYAPQLAAGQTAQGLVDRYLDLTMVLSFEADGVWYQYVGSLNQTITIERNSSGQPIVTSENGIGGTLTPLPNDNDIKHELIRIIPTSPARGGLSLQFDPYDPTLTLDLGTDEKTFWFVVDGTASPWGVTLQRVTFSYESGTNWKEEALDQALGPKGVESQDESGRTLFYTVPDTVVNALENPNDARFKDDPSKSLGPLTLEYTLGVNIDPEVEMEGPSTGA